MVFFSIIIPLYNKELSIRSTLESVINQDYTNFEVIIINDGSTDNSLSVVQSFTDPRIRIISQSNRGVSLARNKGIEVARYSYIVFLDADDLWLKNCLEEFKYLISEFHDARVAVTNFNMSGKNIRGSKRRYYIKDFYYNSAVVYAKWAINLFATGCVAIHKDCFDKVGLFNEQLTHGEDDDMWKRLSDEFIVAKSEVVTMLYRTTAENRASKLPTHFQKRVEYSEINKKLVTSHSQRLLIGCKHLSFSFNSLKNPKNWREFRHVKLYWDWILKSLPFFIKHRIMAKVSFLKHHGLPKVSLV